MLSTVFGNAFRLAAEGKWPGRQPPERLRERVATYFDPLPFYYAPLEAQVTDQNRQSIANRRVIVVHPASRYIGLRADKTVVKAGEPILAKLTRAPGNDSPLGGLKVVSKDGWFAALPLFSCCPHS